MQPRVWLFFPSVQSGFPGWRVGKTELGALLPQPWAPRLWPWPRASWLISSGWLSRTVYPLAVCPHRGLPLLAQRSPSAGDIGCLAHLFRHLPDVLSSYLPPWTGPEFLLAFYFHFIDAMHLKDTWQSLCWPIMDVLPCVTVALICFSISITAVTKSLDGASKAAGVLGFFASIMFATDFYLTLKNKAKFLQWGVSTGNTVADKVKGKNSNWPYGAMQTLIPTPYRQVTSWVGRKGWPKEAAAGVALLTVSRWCSWAQHTKCHPLA